MRNLKLFLFSGLLLVAAQLLNAKEQIARIDSLFNTLNLQSGKERAETLLEISEAYRHISFDKTLEAGQNAIEQTELLGYKALKAKILRSLGNSALMIYDYELAQHYYNESLLVYEELDDYEGIAACHNNIGLVERILGNPVESLQHLEMSLVAENKIGNQIGIAKTYNNIGNLYFDQGYMDQAMDYYYRAKLIYVEENDVYHATVQDSQIAIVYWQWDEWQQTIDLLINCLAVFIEYEDYVLVGRALNNLALVYTYDLEDYQTGIEYFLQSAEVKKLEGDFAGLALTHSNLGNAYAMTGDFDNAKSYLISALEVFKKQGDAQGLVTTNLYFGNLYQLMDDYKQSSVHFEQALRQSDEFGLHKHKPKIVMAQLKNFAALADMDNFLAYFELFKVKFDSTVIRLNKSQVNELRARERYDHVLSESNALMMANQQLESRLKAYRLFLTAIVGILIVILFFLLIKGHFKTTQSVPRVNKDPEFIS